MILLDTCAFVWMSLNQPKLTKRALGMIESNRLSISSMTFMEVGYLIKKGRISIPCGLNDFLSLAVDVHELEVHQITPEISEIAMNFDESVNGDPADRIISATAICNNLKLITSDKNLRKSKSVPTVW
ncbi:MAG: type II toxin-antitoxin system VapC family toxin [Epibacterium sp.]|nr:type II toxin-antitoxin system VapC family toxin [Epibacterium sp.]NQX75529.1 type II toxin-antitoxin system VapC family toxin [Epibacterium sp.]